MELPARTHSTRRVPRSPRQPSPAAQARGRQGRQQVRIQASLLIFCRRQRIGGITPLAGAALELHAFRMGRRASRRYDAAVGHPCLLWIDSRTWMRRCASPRGPAEGKDLAGTKATEGADGIGRGQRLRQASNAAQRLELLDEGRGLGVVVRPTMPEDRLGQAGALVALDDLALTRSTNTAESMTQGYGLWRG